MVAEPSNVKELSIIHVCKRVLNMNGKAPLFLARTRTYSISLANTLSGSKKTRQIDNEYHVVFYLMTI